MGGFKHTGLAAGTTAGDSVRYEQLPSSSNVLAEGSGGTGTTTGYYGFKNRIINGAMMIDQRNGGTEINPAAASTYYLDRWRVSSSQASKFKIGQNAGSVTPPAGYSNYMGCTSLSAYTPLTTEEFSVEQFIEANNAVDLGWGAAGAASITLSFWVRSSLTGTFGGCITNSANNRSYVYSYTISAANTWEQKSVTIAGDTSGTWFSTGGTGRGMRVSFSLGCGPTNTTAAGSWQAGYYTNPTGGTAIVGTSGATFYITGVQLEKGSTATSFDYRPYGTELALCQRYCPVWESTATNSPFAVGQIYSSTNGQIPLPYPVAPRVPATGITTVGTFNILNSTAGAITASLSFNNASFTTLNVIGATAGGVTAGYSTLLTAASSSSKIIGNGCEL
jgi:hypothetical protein